MVTPDEQRALQLENAEADERFWASLQDMHQSTVDDHKRLAATVEQAIAGGLDGAAKAAASVAIAKQRIERIRTGEDVQGGLGKRVDYGAILHEAGFTGKDIQDCLDMAELTDEEFDQFVKDNVDAVERADRAIMRKLLRRRHATEGT